MNEILETGVFIGWSDGAHQVLSELNLNTRKNLFDRIAPNIIQQYLDWYLGTPEYNSVLLETRSVLESVFDNPDINKYTELITSDEVAEENLKLVQGNFGLIIFVVEY